MKKNKEEIDLFVVNKPLKQHEKEEISRVISEYKASKKIRDLSQK